MREKPPQPADEAERLERIRAAGARALAEAAARARPAPRLPPEQGGPAGPEPTRYGDWERKGLATDF